ncbi:hypothetical protein JTB14_017180 [Gonioctena quinquepunctata]|nr:hypothetical protein JTB14_017180 [Gonioctena quinquepunctata]
MHIQEHQLSKEKELTAQLEMVQQQLLPLEQMKTEIELVAHRRGNWLSWAGLGLMSVQFGILARLTWWEYSWDIMEPVTYFVTYGTAMACYAYFVLTKEEYILQDVRDRQHLIVMHKKAKKQGINLDQYNMLRQEAAQLQYTLKKLRNPLKLKLPQRQQAAPVIEIVPETKAQLSDTISRDVKDAPNSIPIDVKEVSKQDTTETVPKKEISGAESSNGAKSMPKK